MGFAYDKIKCRKKNVREWPKTLYFVREHMTYLLGRWLFYDWFWAQTRLRNHFALTWTHRTKCDPNIIIKKISPNLFRLFRNSSKNYFVLFRKCCLFFSRFLFVTFFCSFCFCLCSKMAQFCSWVFTIYLIITTALVACVCVCSCFAYKPCAIKVQYVFGPTDW